MWIRTQDKETLLNVNCIDVYNLNKNEWIIEACGNDLGTYNSKERALEVLDEIQYKIQCLNDDFYFKVSKETELKKYEGYQKQHKDIVYQMPEE